VPEPELVVIRPEICSTPQASFHSRVWAGSLTFLGRSATPFVCSGVTPLTPAVKCADVLPSRVLAFSTCWHLFGLKLAHLSAHAPVLSASIAVLWVPAPAQQGTPPVRGLSIHIANVNLMGGVAVSRESLSGGLYGPCWFCVGWWTLPPWRAHACGLPCGWVCGWSGSGVGGGEGGGRHPRASRAFGHLRLHVGCFWVKQSALAGLCAGQFSPLKRTRAFERALGLSIGAV
jgi:hypothetical protein